MRQSIKKVSIISLFLLLIYFANTQFVELVISSTITEVQQVSTYTFTINLYAILIIPSGTIIFITFPDDYQSLPIQSYNCPTISWTSNATLTCQLENRLLKITGGFPITVNEQDVSLQFKLIDIKNPTASGYTNSFEAKLVNQAGNTLAITGAFGTTTLFVSSGSLSMKLFVSPTTTNQVSTLTINVTTTTKIPKNGWLNLRFDTYWKTNVFNRTQVIDDSVRCSAHTNVSSSINCTIGTATTQQMNLIVKNVFDNDFVGNFLFTIFPFLNPPTIAPQGSFQLTSYNSLTEKQKISSVQNQFITGFTMNQISSARITLTSNVIASVTQIIIQCYINNIISSTDKISIQFPLQVLLTNVTSIIANNYEGTNIMATSGNLLSFTNLTMNAPATVQFVIRNIILPDYVNAFSGFSIKTERNYFGMDFINNPFTFQTTNGLLTAQISAANYEVGVFTDYQLTVSLVHAALSDGTLTVEFGALQYSFTNSSVSQMSCISSKRSGCLLTMVNSNTLKLQNIFINQTYSVILTIRDIQNPLALGPTTPLTITSYKTVSSKQYMVDQSAQSDIVISLLGRKMSSSQFTITSTSNKTDQVCDLLIQVSNRNPVPTNSYLEIELPSQLGIGSSVVCNLACNLISGTKMKVELFSGYSIGSLPLITIFNIRNPMSTAPTSSFAVSLFNSNSQLIQYRLLSDGGITYTALQSAQLPLTISRNSSKNSQSPVLYTFTVSVPFQITGGVLKLNIPNQIQCVSSCTKSYLNTSYYLISQQISTVNKTLIVTANFRNHYSLQPLTISAKYLTSNQLFEYGKSSTTIVNTAVSSMTADISWSNQQLFTNGSMFISNLVFPGSYVGKVLISINFASDFNLSSATSVQLFSKSINQIVLQTTTNQTSISTFEIQNLLYPSTSPSLPIYMVIKTFTSYTISRSSPMYWTVLCNLPCKTCSVSNRSSCDSCYSNSLLVDGYIIYHPDNKQCVRICGDNYYANVTDSKCYKCADSCYNCDNYDQCSSCRSGSYLLKTQSRCYQSICPIGYFIYFNECKLCTQSLHCKSCSNSVSCHSCLDTYFFYQNKCLPNCPLLIVTQNTFTNNCDPCPINCTTCQKLSNLTVKCLSCQNGYYFDQGACYQTCRTPGLVPDGTTCVTCHQSCLTCKTNKYYCLTCSSSSQYKYFYQNTCLISCPNGYYKSQTQPYSCLPCTKPCEYCTNSSVLSCTSCVQDYNLNGNICESICSPTFYPKNGSCLSCVSPCKTCSTQNICFTCVSNFSLFGDQCIPQCSSSYISINNICTRCSDNCKTCSSINYCTSCFNGTYLHQGQCIDPCPSKFYKNDSSLMCVECAYECRLCLNQNYCSACQDGYQLSLINNTCINTCQLGYIPVAGLCTRCNSSCTLCVQTTNKCTQCVEGYYFVPSQYKCVSKCSQPLKHYIQNMSCLQSCIQPSYQQYRTQTINSVTGQYIYCEDCPAYCTQCTSSNFCTSCIQNAIKYQNLCLLQCPQDAPYSFNNTCRTCHIAGCYECDNLLCKQCQSSLLLIGDSLCISSCSVTQAYNTTSKQCQVVIQSNTTSNQSSTNTTISSNSIVSTSNNDLNFIPFPFFILSVLVFLFILVLHFSNKVLLIPLAISSFGIFVTLCAYTCLIVFLLSHMPLAQLETIQLTFIAILALGIGVNFILNILTTVFYLAQVQQPNNNKLSKLSSAIIIILGTIINFSFYQVFNSKLYRFVSINNSQNHGFWQTFNRITKISIFSYCSFIIAGIILTFSLEKSDYLYYSCIQLVILSVVKIGFIVVGLAWPIDYTMSETQSYDVNDSFNKLQDLSIDQKNENNSQISSTTTIHACTQVPHHNASFISNNDLGLTKTRSQFLLHNKKSISQILSPQQIQQGIEKGVFRQDYQEIKKKQKEQKELSLLSSASKMIKGNNLQYKQQKQTVDKQFNIFDLDEQDEQNKANDDLKVADSNQQRLSSIQKTSKQILQSLLEKPGSPSKSRKRSKQTIRVKSTLKQSRESQLHLQTKAQNEQNQNSLTSSSIPQSHHQNQFQQKQQQESLKDDYQQASDKQPYYYRNPNIIFQAIDQDAEAEQYQTKVSQRIDNDDEIEHIDIYKYNTNRSQRPLLPNNFQSQQKYKPSNKPIIKHIRDTQADILSTHKTISNHQNFQNKSNHQNLENTVENQNEQNFVNVFQPKDDLQFDQVQEKINPSPNLWNPANKINKEIIHADLESIYTISDKDTSEDKHHIVTVNRLNKKGTHIQQQQVTSPPRKSYNQTLIEDIQDFDQDNQRPSSIFQPPVKNLLSNIYDQLPKGVKLQNKQPKISNPIKKTNKK